jgi:polysaccharide deacetylase 2 family uncharacterized protein YibQ
MDAMSDAPDEDGEALSEADGEDVDPSADFPDDEDDEDFDFGPDEDDEDDEDEDGGGFLAGKNRWIVIGSGSLAGLVVIGGALAWLMGGDDDEDEAAPQSKSNIPVVSMALPPRGGVGGRRSLNALRTDPSAARRPPTGAGSLNALARGPKAAKTAGRAALAPSPAGRPPGGALVVPAVTDVAYRGLPAPVKAAPLAKAPVADLSEQTPKGTLPKIAADGREAWRVYGRPFKAPPGRVRLAVIVAGLGLSQAATKAAISRLPGAVTLAFDAYARKPGAAVDAARAAGHEVLLSLPMEPANFPVSDPGPLALLTDLEAKKNLERLERILALAPGYVGLLQMMGSRFTTSEQALTPVLEALKKRGLLFVGSRLVPQNRARDLAKKAGLAFATVDLGIDVATSSAAIDAQLARLEALARKQKLAVGIAEPYPVTLARLAAWIPTLAGKKLVLAPVSALATPSTAPSKPAPEKAAPDNRTP